MHKHGVALDARGCTILAFHGLWTSSRVHLHLQWRHNLPQRDHQPPRTEYCLSYLSRKCVQANDWAGFDKVFLSYSIKFVNGMSVVEYNVLCHHPKLNWDSSPHPAIQVWAGPWPLTHSWPLTTQNTIPHYRFVLPVVIKRNYDWVSCHWPLVSAWIVYIGTHFLMFWMLNMLVFVILQCFFWESGTSFPCTIHMGLLKFKQYFQWHNIKWFKTVIMNGSILECMTLFFWLKRSNVTIVLQTDQTMARNEGFDFLNRQINAEGLMKLTMSN